MIDVEVFFRRPAKLTLEFLQARDDRFHFLAQIKPHVEGDLIVAAPRRVQFAPGRTDQLGQAPLDIHVNVFVGLGELELAAVDLALHRLQAPDDFARVRGRDDALLGQHFGVRDAAANIVAVEPGIDVDRRGKSFHRGRRAGAEAPAPKLRFFCSRLDQSKSDSVVLENFGFDFILALLNRRCRKRNAFKRMNPSASACW